ncbi:HAD family hydrolase, partial [Pseudomonas viridiflava]|uniref:HAD family hydrolase n=1 Tax=Pseudomonas viridiflava TaxID=33069 RepID=UPI0023F7CB4E
KPDRRIYEAVLTELAVDACKVWMIGDSQRCDRDGPIALGIKGHYLNRTGAGSPSNFRDLMAFKHSVFESRSPWSPSYIYSCAAPVTLSRCRSET